MSARQVESLGTLILAIFTFFIQDMSIGRAESYGSLLLDIDCINKCDKSPCLIIMPYLLRVVEANVDNQKTVGLEGGIEESTKDKFDKTRV